MLNISQETLRQHEHVTPAYNRIYLTLKTALLKGEFHASQKYSEEELAAFFQTSRTPLRRAIAALEREGFLAPKKEQSDRETVSKKNLLELLEYDTILECAAVARLARKKLTQEELDTLQEINEVFAHLNKNLTFDSKNEKDLRAARDAHLQFHLSIARFCGNRYLYEEINRVKLRLRALSSKRIPSENAPWFDYKYYTYYVHQKILDAVLEHNPEAASAYMRFDLERTKEAYNHSYLNEATTRALAKQNKKI